MTTTDRTAQPDARIAEEAAEWFVEFNSGEPDAAIRATFDKWLRMSPEHVSAYLDILSVWDDAAHSGVLGNRTTQALIVRAQRAENVVTLNRTDDSAGPEQLTSAGSSEARKGSPSPQRSRRFLWSRWGLLAASVLLGIVLAGGTLWWRVYQPPTFATGIGEQRLVRLSDGSTLQLNARTKVRVRFGEAERVVDLVEGQALFNVAKDATRPFVVRSDTAYVRAVGTQFDVYRKSSGTTITVLEGRVAVVQADPQNAGSAAQRAGSEPNAAHERSAVELAAGEQVTVTEAAVQRPVSANVVASMAWRQQELIFDSTPLVEVADEFNRYNTRRLVIVNASALDDFHVTGVFSSTNPASLLRFLSVQPGIRVEELEGEIRVSRE